MPTPNYYEILGVTQQARKNEIKRAYLRLAKQYHPDKNPNDQREYYEAKFQEINEACETLINTGKRRQHDIEQGFRNPPASQPRQEQRHTKAHHRGSSQHHSSSAQPNNYNHEAEIRKAFDIVRQNKPLTADDKIKITLVLLHDEKAEQLIKAVDDKGRNFLFVVFNNERFHYAEELLNNRPDLFERQLNQRDHKRYNILDKWFNKVPNNIQTIMNQYISYQLFTQRDTYSYLERHAKQNAYYVFKVAQQNEHFKDFFDWLNECEHDTNHYTIFARHLPFPAKENLFAVAAKQRAFQTCGVLAELGVDLYYQNDKWQLPIDYLPQDVTQWQDFFNDTQVKKIQANQKDNQGLRPLHQGQLTKLIII